jgi:hypothetical protein
VQYASNPLAGLGIASIWACVILGSNAPFVIDFISSIADGSGVLLSVLIPTCALSDMAKRRQMANKKENVLIEG